MTVMEQLQEYKEHIEAQGYNVYAIMLKGSQNYNLSDEESDVDANAILLPTSIKQLRDGIKKKFTFPDGEVTCHDIYSFVHILAKGNPQWIEVVNSEYTIGEDLSMFKDYVINPSALKGMFMEKVNAFDKLYPSREKYVKQFGYDPKQLHHLVRLYDLLEKNAKVHKYEDDYYRDWLMGIKRGGTLTKEEAFNLRDKYTKLLASIYEKRKIAYKPQEINIEAVDKIVTKYLCKTLP